MIIEFPTSRPRRSTGPIDPERGAVILILPDLRPVPRRARLISEDAERLVRRSIKLLRRARKAAPAPLDGDREGV